MEKIHFKTNINCSSCVRKVTPVLDKIEGIQKWSVDTDDAQKILTVETESVTAKEVMEKVQYTGFEIEVV
jgi:copper chaperone